MRKVYIFLFSTINSPNVNDAVIRAEAMQTIFIAQYNISFWPQIIWLLYTVKCFWT